MGRHVEERRPRGYYVDFSVKAGDGRWPPPWLRPPGERLWVAIAQWGLGAYERYLDGAGEAWLRGALGAGDWLLDAQTGGGPLDGGWVHRLPYPHSFPLSPPWLSAMAQGEGASLLVRLHLETGEDRYAEAAVRALKPMRVPSSEGGVVAELGGRPFPEEYPTRPPSFVLNGAIFSLWGLRDVGLALDGEALATFGEGLDTLAENIGRWDLGYWSRYDLFPHPVTNVASPAYHELHIHQLRAMALVAPRPELEAARERFEGYLADARCAARALAGKVLFRLAVPRNRLAARALPWAHSA